MILACLKGAKLHWGNKLARLGEIWYNLAMRKTGKKQDKTVDYSGLTAAELLAVLAQKEGLLADACEQRDSALSERDSAVNERDTALAQRNDAIAQRDK